MPSSSFTNPSMLLLELPNQKLRVTVGELKIAGVIDSSVVLGRIFLNYGSNVVQHEFTRDELVLASASPLDPTVATKNLSFVLSNILPAPQIIQIVYQESFDDGSEGQPISASINLTANPDAPSINVLTQPTITTGTQPDEVTATNLKVRVVFPQNNGGSPIKRVGTILFKGSSAKNFNHDVTPSELSQGFTDLSLNDADFIKNSDLLNVVAETPCSIVFHVDNSGNKQSSPTKPYVLNLTMRPSAPKILSASQLDSDSQTGKPQVSFKADFGDDNDKWSRISVFARVKNVPSSGNWQTTDVRNILKNDLDLKNGINGDGTIIVTKIYNGSALVDLLAFEGYEFVAVKHVRDIDPSNNVALSGPQALSQIPNSQSQTSNIVSACTSNGVLNSTYTIALDSNKTATIDSTSGDMTVNANVAQPEGSAFYELLRNGIQYASSFGTDFPSAGFTVPKKDVVSTDKWTIKGKVLSVLNETALAALGPNPLKPIVELFGQKFVQLASSELASPFNPPKSSAELPKASIEFIEQVFVGQSSLLVKALAPKDKPYPLTKISYQVATDSDFVNKVPLNVRPQNAQSDVTTLEVSITNDNLDELKILKRYAPGQNGAQTDFSPSTLYFVRVRLNHNVLESNVEGEWSPATTIFTKESVLASSSAPTLAVENNVQNKVKATINHGNAPTGFELKNHTLVILSQTGEVLSNQVIPKNTESGATSTIASLDVSKFNNQELQFVARSVYQNVNDSSKLETSQPTERAQLFVPFSHAITSISLIEDTLNDKVKVDVKVDVGNDNAANYPGIVIIPYMENGSNKSSAQLNYDSATKTFSTGALSRNHNINYSLLKIYAVVSGVNSITVRGYPDN